MDISQAANTIHTEHHWETEDRLTLFAQCWQPEQDPQAAICLVHGLGEHSSRYAHLARVFIENGYSLMSYDLRGHGRSQGPRGFAPSFEALMRDIDLLLERCRQRFPGKRLFLYGHSLGGLLSLNYVLRRKPDLAGVIVTSPGLRTALQEQRLKVLLARFLGALFPSLSLPSGLDPQGISRDPQVVRRYLDDPLVHDRAAVGLGKSLLQAIDYAFEHAPEFSLPLLLMHGTEDNIAYARGSQEFAARVQGDCTLRLWEGMAHELHNEPEKEEVFAFLLDWLARRTA